MAGQDESTYGFSKQDANEIIEKLGLREDSTPQPFFDGRRPIATTPTGESAVCVSHASGIAARSGSALGSASCVRLTISGGTRATTTNTITVYNDFLSAISSSVDIVVTKIDGIWLVIAEDCT